MNEVTFYQPMTIMKATPSGNGQRVEVILKASAENEDTAGETILKTAFADSTMRENFSKFGIYDYNHLSDICEAKMKGASGKELVELQLQKERSIIGYPNRSALAIGRRDEFPTSFNLKEDGIYSHGYIMPEKEFGAEVIKGLAAGMPYGASVSGTAAKNDIVGGKIQKINLRKIAIAPLGEVINQETYVNLWKTKLVKLENVVKSLNDMPEEIDTGEVKDEVREHMKYNDIYQKLHFIMEVLSECPSTSKVFYTKLFNEIDEKIRTGKIELNHSPIKNYLLEMYCNGDRLAADRIATTIIQAY